MLPKSELMSAFKTIISDLRRQAVLDQKICNRLRVQQYYYQDQHRGLSYWHLKLAAGAWNTISIIRSRFSEPS